MRPRLANVQPKLLCARPCQIRRSPPTLHTPQWLRGETDRISRRDRHGLRGINAILYTRCHRERGIWALSAGGHGFGSADDANDPPAPA